MDGDSWDGEGPGLSWPLLFLHMASLAEYLGFFHVSSGSQKKKKKEKQEKKKTRHKQPVHLKSRF